MNIQLPVAWLGEFAADAAAFVLSVGLVAIHYLTHAAKVRRDPAYSIHFVNELTRRIWVESVMGNPGRDVMAVQTLRNFIMVGILMVSTATLLIMGTLTLSGQTENIAKSWHALNLVGSHAAGLWMVKVMCLLADFLAVFFAYAMGIRLATHVLFMVNVPKEFQEAHEALSPDHVARRLNRAGRMFAVGMRALVFAVPLAFWLFGPVHLLAATAVVVLALTRLDRHREGF